MKKFFKSRKGAAMAEAAITLPLVILLTLALVNLALAGYASVAASNAANYGARVGAVSQSNKINNAIAAAQTKINQTGIGGYLITASGGGARGSQISVNVRWSVPNYFGGLLALFGGTNTATITGTSQASFRQEGW